MTPTTILNCLSGLAANNNREWYHAHKAEYQEANGQFEMLIQDLIFKIGETDGSILHNTPKDLTFRLVREYIYRHAEEFLRIIEEPGFAGQFEVRAQASKTCRRNIPPTAPWPSTSSTKAGTSRFPWKTACSRIRLLSSKWAASVLHYYRT